MLITALERQASEGRCAADMIDRSRTCKYPKQVALLHSGSCSPSVMCFGDPAGRLLQ